MKEEPDKNHLYLIGMLLTSGVINQLIDKGLIDGDQLIDFVNKAIGSAYTEEENPMKAMFQELLDAGLIKNE